MFNFNLQFFEKHQALLLKIANSKWLRWLLGLNRLPKELKKLKIDKITPNSIHHIVESKLTKKGKFKKQKITAEFFTRPRFAEALVFNLSPFCYFQELRSKKMVWRFSPAGLAYILLFGLLGKFAGLPLAFMGTTETYYAHTTGSGRVGYSDNSSWSTTRDATTGITATPGDTDSYICRVRHLLGNYIIDRNFQPINTSGLPDSAIISSATYKIWLLSYGDTSSDGHDYAVIVQTSQSDTTTFTTADYDLFGTTEGSDQFSLSGSLATGEYKTFTLNATGLGWINKTGYTKLGVRGGGDITNNAPPDNTYYQFYGYCAAQTGTDKDPYLSVTYSVPVTAHRFFNLF